nr:MAG TPA: hypothetical protein [Caudoviricetes sp.]
MERLTKREISGITYNNSPGFICSCYCDNCSKGTGDCDRLKAMVNRLAKFEDLEEQGLLVRLPCKVGDTVYKLWYYDGKPYKIQQHVIRTLSELLGIMESKKFGKSVFLTSEEAEKKLEELGNDKT